jgi:hypothetical protein
MQAILCVHFIAMLQHDNANTAAFTVVDFAALGHTALDRFDTIIEHVVVEITVARAKLLLLKEEIVVVQG